MQDFTGWVREFLARRGLERPNGQMLFSYRAAKEEYLALRAMFAERITALQGDPWVFKQRAESACFVLYAAEWWRREYAGGAWRWLHILESIAQSPVNLDVLERSAAVEWGLRAWGHLPSGAGKRYLGAIVANGGLPLQLVAKGDGAISRLLIRGTRQAQQFGWDAARLEAFFQAYELELVQHLRDEDIYRLLAMVVTTVLDLRRQYNLAGSADPVGHLDRMRPDWRQAFPMAVDDKSAEPLLVGLVKEAAREMSTAAAYPVIATRTLRESAQNGAFQLVLSLQMPATIALESLAAACDISADSIPQSFSMEAIGSGKLALGEARQLLGAQSQVMLSARTQRVVGQDAAQEHMLVLRSTGEALHEAVGIPGADGLDDFQPWVFAIRQSENVLMGVGSCRVAEERALLAVSAEAQVIADSEDSQATVVGEMQDVQPARRIYEISGSVSIQLDSSRFFVRTKQVAGVAEQLLWRGTRAPYSAGPFPVYQGVPHLCRLTADGLLAPVHPKDIHWVMPMRQGTQVDSPKGHRGPIDAWLVEGGMRVRRFRMALVAQDARVRFRSGDSPREGSVEFKGWGFSQLDTSAELTKRVEVLPDVARWELASETKPPAQIGASVVWPHSTLALRLELPFPSSGGRFLTSNGAQVTKGALLPLKCLPELRAQVFSRNPEAPKRYTLMLELAGTVGGSVVSEHAISLDKQGFGELRLLELESSVRGIMCQSSSLDARLNIRIYQAGSVIAEMRLVRYDAELETKGASMTLSEQCLASHGVQVIEQIVLEAVPLLTSDAGSKLSQSMSDGVPVGSWPVAQLAADRGPWLVYPAVESSLQLRPSLYAGFAIGTQNATSIARLCPLGQAMSSEEASERAIEIEAVVSAMSCDLDHRSWGLVRHHYQQLSHLPLSTLDYWRAIGRDPRACIAAVLKLAGGTQLMDRMRDELGLIWALTPKAVLSEVLALLTKTWARQFNVEEHNSLVHTIVKGEFPQLGLGDTVLQSLVDVVWFESGIEHSQELTSRVARMAATSPSALLQKIWVGEDCLVQRFLLRQHVDDRVWPCTGLANDLIHIIQANEPAYASRLSAEFGKRLVWMPTAGQSGPHSKNLKEDVANAPLLAGLLAQLCTKPQQWRTPEIMSRLLRIRSFDPAWFDESCRIGTLIALSLTAPQASHHRRAPRPAEVG